MTLPQPPPQPPLPVPEKKGLSGLAWTGIGCGVVLLIAVAAIIGGSIFVYNKAKSYAGNPDKMLAELIVASSPELQKISSDDAKKEMTVRTKAGETFTVSYEDLTNGKFSFKDSTGKVTTVGGSKDFSSVPSWGPQTPRISGLPSVFPIVLPGKSKGFYTAETEGTVGETDSFFKGFAEAAGFTQSSYSSTNFEAKETMVRTYKNGNKEFTVTINGETGKPTSTHVVYEEK
ncbi:MAG TPA: hypothetical protein VM511_05645 [Luteolibacter sp.]|nr:hypothetical protein [Luteolibacter sp.]